MLLLSLRDLCGGSCGFQIGAFNAGLRERLFQVLILRLDRCGRISDGVRLCQLLLLLGGSLVGLLGGPVCALLGSLHFRCMVSLHLRDLFLQCHDLRIQVVTVGHLLLRLLLLLFFFFFFFFFLSACRHLLLLLMLLHMLLLVRPEKLCDPRPSLGQLSIGRCQ